MKPLFVKVQPRTSAAAARVDVYAATGGQAAAYSMGGFRADAAITRRPRMSIELFSLSLDGKVQLGRADLALNVSRLRQHPAAKSYYWLGAPITIWDASAADLSTAPVEFTGYVKSSSFDVATDTLVLNLEVSATALDRPVLFNEFSGAGGVNGDAQLRGTLKPAGFGTVQNVEPVWFDNTNNIGMIDGYGNCTAITSLFEGGNDFGAKVADYPDYATLVARIADKTVPPGRWATCVAAGLVGLGAPPVKPITVDATFGTNRPGAFIQRLLNTHAAIALGSIDTTAMAALDASVNYPVHYWTNANRSVKDLVEAIAASCNATPLVTFQGKYSVTRAFGGANVLTINKQAPTRSTRVTNWRTLDPDAPVWRMRARAARPGVTLTIDQINYADDLIDRGVYSSTTVYRLGNLVWRNDGAQFLYTNPTAAFGLALPVPPATNNSFWTMTKPPQAASDMAYADGSTIESLKPAEAGANVTGTHQALSIQSQGALATASSALWSTQVTGSGKPADNATVGATLGVNIFDTRSGPAVVVSAGALVTLEGQAASITGQGSLATASSVKFGSGTPVVFRENGTTPVTDAAVVTSQGTAASIQSQGSLATQNTADFSTQVSGATKPADNANVAALGDANRVRFSRFEQGTLGWTTAAGYGGANVGITKDVANGIPYLGTGTTFAASGSPTGQSATFGTDTSLGANSPFVFPVTGNERIFCGAGIGIDATQVTSGSVTWALSVGFLDSSGAEVGSRITVATASTGIGYNTPVGAFGYVPSTAVCGFWRLDIVRNGTSAVAYYNGFLTNPMVCGAVANQTAPPTFTPGPTGEAGAQVNRYVKAPAQSLVFDYNPDGSVAFASPRSLYLTLVTPAGPITSGVSWAWRGLSGGWNGVSPTYYGAATTVSNGEGQFDVYNLQASEVTLQFEATYQGQVYPLVLTLKKNIRSAGSGGSSGAQIGGAIANTTISNTTFVSVTGNMTGTPSTGNATVSVALDVTPQGSTTGAWDIEILIQRDGVSVDSRALSSSYDGPSHTASPASFNYQFTQTGIGASSHTWNVYARVQTGGTRSHTVAGTVTVNG